MIKTEQIWGVEDFLSQYESPSTVHSYKVAFRQFFSLIYPQLNDIKGSKSKDEFVNRASISYLSEDRDFRKDIIAYKKTLEDKAPKTRLTRLSPIFRFFEDNGHTFSHNFTNNVFGKGRNPETDEHIPTAEEIGRICEYLPIQAKALSLFIASSGMRPGEALQITLRDLDLDRNPPRINIPGPITKAKKKRISFITPEAKEVVEEWLRFRKQFLKRSSKRGTAKRKAPVDIEDERLFPFTHDNYMFLWKEALKKAGLYKKDKRTGFVTLRPHNLRKFFSTYGKWTNPDIPDALQGHARGMRAIYDRYDKAEEILEEAYLEAVPSLTIFAHSQNVLELQERVDQQSEDIQKLITNLSVENVRLKEMVENLAEKLGSLEALKERIEELEDYIEIGVLRKEAKRIRGEGDIDREAIT